MELFHYGTKGMKWGVRKYQNSDGSLTPAGKERYSKAGITIKKGTKLFRIADINEHNIKPGAYVGVKQNFSDLVKYRNTFKQRTGKNFVEKTLIAKGDIRIPSTNSASRVMKKTLDSFDKTTLNTIKNRLRDDISSENNASDRVFTRALKEFDSYNKSGIVGTNLYSALNISFADRRSKELQSLANKFYSDLSDSGYHGVKDLNDILYGQMNAKMPIILADVGKVKISTIKPLK